MKNSVTLAVYYFTSAFLVGPFMVTLATAFEEALDIETTYYWVCGLLLAAWHDQDVS